MSVLRRQDLVDQTVTLAAGVPLAVLVDRPTTTPAFGNTIDHVTEPFDRREQEQALLTVTFDGTLGVAATEINEIAVVSAAGSPFTPTPTALFPTGATSSTRRVIFAPPAGVPSDDTDLLAFLSELVLQAEEQLEITFENAGGVTGNLRARYDSGKHQSEYAIIDQS